MSGILGSGILGFIGLICAIWVIYDVWAQNKSLSETNRILWTIFAMLFSIVAAIVYYFTHKKSI